MVLRMKILVCWRFTEKIQLLGWGSRKINIETVFRFKGGIGKKEEDGGFKGEGGGYPNAHDGVHWKVVDT